MRPSFIKTKSFILWQIGQVDADDVDADDLDVDPWDVDAFGSQSFKLKISWEEFMIWDEEVLKKYETLNRWISGDISDKRLFKWQRY